MAAEWRSPWAVISPTPSARHAARSRRLNARLENGSPEYPANTNCDPAKAIPPGTRIRRPLKPSWMSFHSRSAALKASRDRHILEDAPLALNPESHNFFSCLAIWPSELDQFLEPAGGLEESVGQVGREGGAVVLPPGLKIVEEPTDLGEEQVAYLGLLLERGLDLR